MKMVMGSVNELHFFFPFSCLFLALLHWLESSNPVLTRSSESDLFLILEGAQHLSPSVMLVTGFSLKTLNWVKDLLCIPNFDQNVLSRRDVTFLSYRFSFQSVNMENHIKFLRLKKIPFLSPIMYYLFPTLSDSIFAIILLRFLAFIVMKIIGLFPCGITT